MRRVDEIRDDLTRAQRVVDDLTQEFAKAVQIPTYELRELHPNAGEWREAKPAPTLQRLLDEMSPMTVRLVAPHAARIHEWRRASI